VKDVRIVEDRLARCTGKVRPLLGQVDTAETQTLESQLNRSWHLERFIQHLARIFPLVRRSWENVTPRDEVKTAILVQRAIQSQHESKNAVLIYTETYVFHCT